jgi:hypothetical protein
VTVFLTAGLPEEEIARSIKPLAMDKRLTAQGVMEYFRLRWETRDSPGPIDSSSPSFHAPSNTAASSDTAHWYHLLSVSFLGFFSQEKKPALLGFLLTREKTTLLATKVYLSKPMLPFPFSLF